METIHGRLSSCSRWPVVAWPRTPETLVSESDEIRTLPLAYFLFSPCLSTLLLLSGLLHLAFFVFPFVSRPPPFFAADLWPGRYPAFPPWRLRMHPSIFFVEEGKGGWREGLER